MKQEHLSNCYMETIIAWKFIVIQYILALWEDINMFAYDSGIIHAWKVQWKTDLLCQLGGQ